MTTTAYLTPTHVLEYLFCPRFTYFEHVLQLPEYQERRFKVLKGREIHEERTKINPSYLRKKLGVVKREHEVQLASEKLGLRGIVDEVLWLEDGTMAPFDYKFAEWKGRVFKNLKVQSALYALLIRERYAADVNKGFLCYVRSKHKVVELPMTAKLLADAETAVIQVFEIIRNGSFPEGTKSKARCSDCCYRNVCVM